MVSKGGLRYVGGLLLVVMVIATAGTGGLPWLVRSVGGLAVVAVAVLLLIASRFALDKTEYVHFIVDPETGDVQEEWRRDNPFLTSNPDEAMTDADVAHGRSSRSPIRPRSRTLASPPNRRRTLTVDQAALALAALQALRGPSAREALQLSRATSELAGL